jgi:acyl-CoA thioesterase-1
LTLKSAFGIKKEDMINGVTKIITVGDSITEGWLGEGFHSDLSYPTRLREMLNDAKKYEVINLGLGGRTMMRTGDMPYWNE